VTADAADVEQRAVTGQRVDQQPTGLLPPRFVGRRHDATGGGLVRGGQQRQGNCPQDALGPRVAELDRPVGDLGDAGIQADGAGCLQAAEHVADAVDRRVERDAAIAAGVLVRLVRLRRIRRDDGLGDETAQPGDGDGTETGQDLGLDPGGE